MIYPYPATIDGRALARARAERLLAFRATDGLYVECAGLPSGRRLATLYDATKRRFTVPGISHRMEKIANAWLDGDDETRRDVERWLPAGISISDVLRFMADETPDDALAQADDRDRALLERAIAADLRPADLEPAERNFMARGQLGGFWRRRLETLLRRKSA